MASAYAFSLLWPGPVVLARSSQSVIGFCDALMIAPLGEESLAATTTGAINIFAVIILPMGMAFIVQSFASQLHGKGDLAGARRYAWYGLILAAACMVAATAVIPLVDPIIGIFPHAPAVHHAMTDYISIRLFAVGAIIAIEVLGNWYGGLGNTRLHMIASMVAMVLNVALNWLLIEGNLGFPAMGVEGRRPGQRHRQLGGIRTPGPGVLQALGRRQDHRQARPAHLGVRSHAALRRAQRSELVSRVCRLCSISQLGRGRPGAGDSGGDDGRFADQFGFLHAAFGISSAGAIMVGQAIGRKEYDDVEKIVGQTGAVAAVWQVSVGLLYVAIPTALMSLFAPPTENGPQFLAVGASMLIISAAWQLFDAWAMTMSEALRAAGDTAWCMWARLTLAWAFFTPGAIVAVQVLGGGPNVAITCVVLYLAALALLLVWRFYTGAWRDIDLTGSDPGDEVDGAPGAAHFLAAKPTCDRERCASPRVAARTPARRCRFPDSEFP